MKIIKIGSNHSNDIKVTDPTVSRLHAEIFWDGHEIIVITDKNSTNGTYVNGKRISEPTRLNKLDILKVGTTLVDWMSHIDNSSKEEAVIQEEGITEVNEPIKVKNPHNNKMKFFLIFILIISLILTLLVIPPAKKVYGCTDVNAYNFNSKATHMKDSSCVLYDYILWNSLDKGTRVYVDNKKYKNARYSFIYNTSDTIKSKWDKYLDGKTYLNVRIVKIDTIFKTIPNNGNGGQPPYFNLPIRDNVIVIETLNTNKVNRYSIDIRNNTYLLNPNQANRYKIDRRHYVLIGIPDYLQPKTQPFDPKYRTNFFNVMNYSINYWFQSFPETINLGEFETEAYKYNLVRY